MNEKVCVASRILEHGLRKRTNPPVCDLERFVEFEFKKELNQKLKRLEESVGLLDSALAHHKYIGLGSVKKINSDDVHVSHQ